MIITLTLNPSLDRTIEVDRLTRGAVIRATSARLDPGGKGVNVCRALLANDVESAAVVTVGGPDGDQLIHLLEFEGITVTAVPVSGRTRSNVTIVEPDGVVTKLNEPGGTLTTPELKQAIAAVADAAVNAAASAPSRTVPGAVVVNAAGRGDWLVACGSLPPGVPSDVYAGVCRSAHAAGLKVAIDTSGPPLLAALGARPDLVKPNREELAEAVGHPVVTVADAIQAARVLRKQGARSVLASLGPDGAVLVEEDGTVITGEAAVTAPRSTVGAGDALLAGFLAAGAAGAPALAEALAWGAAAVSLPASRMPGPADLRRDQVRIHPRPDTSRSLIT